MKKQTGPRKRKQINEKRLAAYTAAAGAALLAAAPADAAIQYTSADITVGNGSAYIDLDGNSTNDLGFMHNYSVLSCFPRAGEFGCKYRVDGNFSNLNGVSFAGVLGQPSNLDQGAAIGVSNNWVNGNGALFGGYRTVFHSSFGFYSSRLNMNLRNDPFITPGYMGIRFDPGDGTKYGWIHISSVELIYYTIDGWAYDDSGQAIAAGQTIVPEPTGIALFAAGAATIMAKRRWKKK
ncbi:MAG: PEP-CTERM sorting domain-containing protein [Nitrospirae bacterium]|nr:PEP-CTERM sorting domain-containing protein [Nitrospirota bacterium]